MGIEHAFVSAKADGADATLVRPVNWNANHVLSGGSAGNVLVYGTNVAFWNSLTCNLTNRTGGGVVSGDVVAIDSSNNSSVALADTVGSTRQFVVAGATIADTAAGLFSYKGPIAVVRNQGAVTRGNYVRKSATTLAIEDTGVAQTSAAPPGAVGIALATAGGSGTMAVFWFGYTAPGSANYFPTCELSGLGTTRTSTTSITVAVGAAASADAALADRVLMSLTSAITGTTSGTFVVGNNQPKLDAGAIGNNQSWHVFLIRREDTFVVDILFSQSATAPTMPANYTKKRRIASFKTDGSANIRNYTQRGDFFQHMTPILDFDAQTLATASALKALTIPSGVKFNVLMNVVLGNGSTTAYFSDPDTTDVNPVTAATIIAGGSAAATPALASIGNTSGDTSHASQVMCGCDTSGQVRMDSDSGSGLYWISTVGWWDARGKE